MRSRFLIYLITASIFAGNSNYLLSSNEKNLEINDLEIPSGYLGNLPSNDYIIGSGDELKILVSRELRELDTTALVDGEGTIYVPKLNRIFVKGLSIKELNKTLNKAYEKFVRFPEVEVVVSKYRPIRVVLQGEVLSPGVQILQGSFDFSTKETVTADSTISNFFPTVFDAIRSAGGITEFSDITNIEVIRQNSISNGGGKIFTKLNFIDLITKGDISQNIRIYDSDIIKVSKAENSNKELFNKAILLNLNPKFINVYVTGRVSEPGYLKISSASVLTDAIDIAGGTKALKGPITFIRVNNDGSVDKRVFKYRRQSKRGSYKNPKLISGDLVFVGESSLTITNEVIQEITGPITGIFSTYGLFKAIQN